MLRKSLLSLSLLLFSYASYSQDIELIFSNLAFNLPSGHNTIVSTDTAGGMLAFMYTKSKGKDFIALFDKTDDASIQYGCAPSTFYTELFTPTGTTSCDKKILEGVHNGLIQGGRTKVWKTPQATINYLDTRRDVGSFVFICTNEGKTIKINSDFLEEDGYKKVLSNFF
jgi:hypothetical protein